MDGAGKQIMGGQTMYASIVETQAKPGKTGDLVAAVKAALPALGQKAQSAGNSRPLGRPICRDAEAAGGEVLINPAFRGVAQGAAATPGSRSRPRGYRAAFSSPIPLASAEHAALVRGLELGLEGCAVARRICR